MTSDSSKCHTMYLQFIHILYEYNARIYLLCSVIFYVFKFTSSMKWKIYLISILVDWGLCKLLLGSPRCRWKDNCQEMNLNSNCILWWPECPGLVWKFKYLPSTHTETSIWHAKPFTSTFYRDQQDNIKLDLKDVALKGIPWICAAQDRDVLGSCEQGNENWISMFCAVR
jgi:hypothetical protein